MAYPVLETQHYTLGKGVLMFQQQETYSDDEGYRDFGNVSAFNITVEVEKIEHYSSRSGAKVKDGETTIQKKASGSFTVDDVNMNNTKMFFLGKTLTETAQAADTGATATIAKAALDRWQPIKVSTVRQYNISSVVVKDVTDAITYDVGDDYEVDLAAGLIRVLSAGIILEDAELHLTFDVAALDHHHIDGLMADNVKGHVFFKADPPDGKIQDAYGYVNITPSGEWGAISDEYRAMQFNIEFIKVSQYSGVVDLVERGYVEGV